MCVNTHTHSYIYQKKKKTTKNQKPNFHKSDKYQTEELDLDQKGEKVGRKGGLDKRREGKV